MRRAVLALALGLTLAAPLAVGLADEPKPAAKEPVAVVKDEWGVDMEVQDPTFVRPAGGLMTGGKGTKLKELHVWKGAHEILIPLADIVKIEVTGKNEGDLVPVKLALTSDREPFEGKVERDLEIQGKVRQGQYKIRFDRVKSVTMRP